MKKCYKVFFGLCLEERLNENMSKGKAVYNNIHKFEKLSDVFNYIAALKFHYNNIEVQTFGSGFKFYVTAIVYI